MEFLGSFIHRPAGTYEIAEVNTRIKWRYQKKQGIIVTFTK